MSSDPVVKTAPGGPQASRRAVIALAGPAIGLAGVLLAAARPAAAAKPASRQQNAADDDDGSSPTAHREAYYRRARF